MVIIKVPFEKERELKRNYNYIPLCITPTHKYVVVEQTDEYEIVSSVPEMSEIIETDFKGIINYLTFKSNSTIANDIEKIRELLSESDYKITKAYEYFLVGKKVDYDVEDLHNERQSLRDQINDLESKIKENKTWEELDNIIIKNKT